MHDRFDTGANSTVSSGRGSPLQNTKRADRPTQGTVSCWPSQDIRSRPSFCARVQHSLIAPAAPTMPTLLLYRCNTIEKYTTPSPTLLLGAIHHTILVRAISREGQDAAWRTRAEPESRPSPTGDSLAFTRCLFR